MRRSKLAIGDQDGTAPTLLFMRLNFTRSMIDRALYAAMGDAVSAVDVRDCQRCCGCLTKTEHEERLRPSG